MIECKHATIDGRKITCGLGLFGGTPHIGVCMKCRNNGNTQNGPSPKKRRMPSLPETQEAPCPRKLCRLGDRECDSYWGCRDTCRIVNKRLTSMEECPEVLYNEYREQQ